MPYLLVVVVTKTYWETIGCVHTYLFDAMCHLDELHGIFYLDDLHAIFTVKMVREEMHCPHKKKFLR